MSLGIAPIATLRRLLDLALLLLIALVFASLVVARVVPLVTHSPTFVVAGRSMEPTIHLGSVVITQPVVPADLRAGDVVSLRVGAQDAVFTHRIARVATAADGSRWIETKGDANPSADPTLVPASAVLGRVAVAVPYLGYLVQLLATAQGIALLVSLGLVTLLGAWLLEELENDRRTALRRRTLDVIRDGADAPADGWTPA